MPNTYLRGKTHTTINKVKLYKIAGTYNNEIVKKSKFKITNSEMFKSNVDFISHWLYMRLIF